MLEYSLVAPPGYEPTKVLFTQTEYPKANPPLICK